VFFYRLVESDGRIRHRSDRLAGFLAEAAGNERRRLAHDYLRYNSSDMRIPLAKLVEARALLERHFPPTPLIKAAGRGAVDEALFLKVEPGLPTGSFKVRGAVYALSVNARTQAIGEVIAASTGNHGAAVAYAGRLLGIPATIFLPEHPNPVKAQRIRDCGARIVESGRDLSTAIDAAYEYARRSGAFFLHDAADPDVPAGAGTIGLEVLDQLPSVETIYVPMGDTALIRGVASAAKQLKPSISIIGVVADRAPAYFLSWQRRVAVETPSADTIADGLAVRRPLQPNVDDVCALVDDVRLVSENEMLAAIEYLSTDQQVRAEPAGAAATAAYLKDANRRRVTVALVTGGNRAPDSSTPAQI
jgi:threonine dehydratase